MNLVIADTSLLIDLHHRKMVADLFSTGHTFHLVDIVAEKMDEELRDLVVAGGTMETSMASGEMSALVHLFRACPSLCVCEAASIVVAETRGLALLGGSHPRVKLHRPLSCEAFDHAWVLGEIKRSAVPAFAAAIDPQTSETR